MSNLRIKVVAVELVTVPTAKGSYQTLDVTYRNLDFGDKVETKKIMSFTFKEVFNTLKTSAAGDTFTISRTKNDKGFWDWTDASAGESGVAGQAATPTKSSVTAARTPYETPEERAARQVYIVRQSSITNAIETLKTDKKNPSKEEVVEVAKYYEAFVFGQVSEPNKAATPVAKVALPVVEDEDVPM
jgi:hypothetical protein